MCIFFRGGSEQGERCIYTIHVFKARKVIKVRHRSPDTHDTENNESWRSSELIPLEPFNCKRAWETEAAFPTTETTIVLYFVPIYLLSGFLFSILWYRNFWKCFQKKYSEISRIYTTRRISQIVFWQKKNNKISRRNWLLYLSTPSWEIS